MKKVLMVEKRLNLGVISIVEKKVVVDNDVVVTTRGTVNKKESVRKENNKPSFMDLVRNNNQEIAKIEYALKY